MRVLLVEPDYKSKYPPLGLLKLGTYHCDRGDEVRLVRGKLKEADHWDRVYITTLFSFYHAKTIDTILHYKKVMGEDLSRIFVGGAYATLFPDAIFQETGIWPYEGLLNKANAIGLGSKDKCIDSLIPNYDLLKDIDYDYGLADCYYGYATRGCVRKCPFCAVHRIEPDFNPYTGLAKYIKTVIKKYGERQNMVLMDNNVLASNSFNEIINDIVKLGFHRGAKRNNRLRFIDFNQGLDMRFITRAKAKLLSQIALRPVRIAYDNSCYKDQFEKSIHYLADEGFRVFSTYVLYNFNETPSDFYNRLEHCIELNEKLDIQISPFPMRYAPLGEKNRNYFGPHWNRRRIRGVQCILNVTKGIVSHRSDMFYHAFGDTPEDFDEITAMPELYILQREDHEEGLAAEWRKVYRKLSDSQRKRFFEIVSLPSDHHSKIAEAYDTVKSKVLKELLHPFLKNTTDEQ